jgi:hypothetical protein
MSEITDALASARAEPSVSAMQRSYFKVSTARILEHCLHSGTILHTLLQIESSAHKGELWERM